MNMDLMDTPIRLVVKAPNQRVGDQTVDCALNWTVQKLKNYLAEVYPSQPKIEDQKLIYSGQLLLDHLMLKDVLRQYDVNCPHILHLVCTPVKEMKSSPTETTSNQNSSSSQSSSQSSNVATANQSTSDGVRHRNINSESQNRPQPSTNQSVPPAGQYTGFNPTHFSTPFVPVLNIPPDQMAQQMLWMQHVYAQYMNFYAQQYIQTTQLQNFLTSSPIVVPPPSSTAAVAPSSLNVRPAAAPVPPQQPQPPPPPQAPRPQNDNMRMNAQGGLVDDDDEEIGANRDWLDWFYILSRVVILFSIVYFYSSLSRLLAVSLMVALFYMYQAGLFQNRRRLRQQAQPAIPPQPPAGLQRNEEIPNDDNNNHARQNIDENDDQMRREAQDIENMMDNDIDAHAPLDPGPSIWNVTWSILIGFFSSLIPENPGHV